MIKGIDRILGLSLLFVLGVPFAVFAVFTTSIAVVALFIRLLTVYVDLGFELIQSALSPSPKNFEKTPAKPSNSPAQEAARVRRKRSIVSPATPTTNHFVRKSPSFASLIGSGTDRDYEGVGGWRIPVDDDEEAIWIGMNRNLELPASPAAVRSHRRSLTGPSQRTSPEMGRSPVLVRNRTPGTSSPEGYFSMPMTQLESSGSAIWRNSGASSSTTSIGSKSGVPGVTLKATGPD